ncbi:MAG: stage 0 sporulation family protein [Lactobacillales bacterium]|nr:stage 0 sporulation family protein [Lactobacillales bacterium]
MVEVVGVRFRKSGHVYYYSPNSERFQYKEKVIVDSAQGRQLGEVALVNRAMDEEDLPEQVKPVLARATQADEEKAEQNKMDAQIAMQKAKVKIREHGLEMKLIQVEYTFDRSKLIFSFTADGRVDFRELVKDLASMFKTRIELRQIGVRDEAKILGGLGPCGRPLCCSTFLGDFMPVSIKMAKDQGLSLNPVKISGLCGRLMCCLKYENDEYEAARKELPDWGTTVVTPDGIGRVEGLNLLSRVLKVRLRGRETLVEYDYEEIKEMQQKAKGDENG